MNKRIRSSASRKRIITHIVFFLLLATASANAQTKSEPNEDLIIAINNKDLDAVKKILDSGVNVNDGLQSGYTALMQAIYMNNYEIVKVLLANNADPNVGSGNCPALWVPCLLGEYDIVKALIDAGADPNARDKKGNTSLFYVKGWYAHAVEYLIENRNNVIEAQNGNLKVASDKVVAWNNIINLLLSAGGIE